MSDDLIGNIMEYTESSDLMRTCSTMRDAWSQKKIVIAKNLVHRLGGKEALIKAAEYDQLDICKLLLDPKHFGQENVRSGVQDALWAASIWSNTDVICYLVSKGDELRLDTNNVLADVIGSCDDVEVCRLLLDRDVCGDRAAHADANNNDLLERAASDGSFEICRALMDQDLCGKDHVADPFANEGRAVKLAANNQHWDVCALLTNSAISSKMST